jgi:hypothetical protein
MTLTASQVYKSCQICDFDHRINQMSGMTRICGDEIGYIRAHIPVLLLCLTRQSWLKDPHDVEQLTGYTATISIAATLTVAERA